MPPFLAALEIVDKTVDMLSKFQQTWLNFEQSEFNTSLPIQQQNFAKNAACIFCSVKCSLSYITHEYAMKRFEKEAAAGRIKKIYFFNFFIPFRSLFRLYPLWVLSRFPTLVRHSFVTQKRDGLRKTTDDDTIHLSLVPLAKILRCRHQENSFFVLAKC